MTDLSFFEKAFAQSEGVKRLYNDVCELRNNNNGTIKVCGLQGSSRAIAAHSLFCKLAKEDVCFVAVLDSYDDAAYFFQDFQKLSHNGILGNNIVFFPSETKRKGNNFVRDEDNIIMRTEVLGRLAHKDSPLAIITYPQAIAKKVPGAEEVSKRSFTVKENSCLDVAETENKLREWGFKPVDYVYAPGEYAVRGSIIDIFSYSCPDPIRIDLFGDDVESVRTFDVTTQLSIEKISSVIIAPQASSSGKTVPITNLFPDNTVYFTGNLAFDAAKIDEYKDSMTEDKPEDYIVGEAFLGLPCKNVVIECGVTQDAKAGKHTRTVSFHTSRQPL